jgi:hypothetical protein
MTAFVLYSPASSSSESSADNPSEAKEGSCSPLLAVNEEVRTKVADTEVISLIERASDHGLIVAVITNARNSGLASDKILVFRVT